MALQRKYAKCCPNGFAPMRWNVDNNILCTSTKYEHHWSWGRQLAHLWIEIAIIGNMEWNGNIALDLAILLDGYGLGLIWNHLVAWHNFMSQGNGTLFRHDQNGMKCNFQRRCTKSCPNELELNRWNVQNVKIFTFPKYEDLWWRERWIYHFRKRNIIMGYVV